MNVYFNHGKESGPWGTKISALAAIARQKGFSVKSPNYSEQPDPDTRVEQLLTLRLPASDVTVLVGSSMGGYVATVASQIINPVGLFLMAPAFYLPGYKDQSPAPNARKTVIIHGLKDDVVPVENSIRFAREHSTELHLIDGDHCLNDQLPKIEMLFDLFLDEVIELSELPKILTWEIISRKFGQKAEWVAQIWEELSSDGDHSLNDQLPKIEMLFDQFLDEVLELSDLPKTVTWEKMSQKFGQEAGWVAQIWEVLVSDGHAHYSNEAERINVLLKFFALTDFHHEFLSEFSRYPCESVLEVTADNLDIPIDVFERLLAGFAVRQSSKNCEKTFIQMELEAIFRESVYPTILEHYRGYIYSVVYSLLDDAYPTKFDEDIEDYPKYPDNPENFDLDSVCWQAPRDYLLDPENLEDEDIDKQSTIDKIHEWLLYKLKPPESNRQLEGAK